MKKFQKIKFKFKLKYATNENTNKMKSDDVSSDLKKKMTRLKDKSDVIRSNLIKKVTHSKSKCIKYADFKASLKFVVKQL